MRRYSEIQGTHRERPGIGWRARFLASLLALSTICAAISMLVSTVGATAAVPTTLSGVTSADAAASCWEIKQRYPSSADGVYWLRNDALVRPERFYCDMTTEGGGWVLIGRGREGWTFRDDGQSTGSRLRNDVTGPAAFAPAALSSETIDGLLGGGAVEDLSDGVRLRRAADVAGTSWQELRWHLLDLGRWSWAIGGGHRLAGYSIDGVPGTGSNTKDSSLQLPGETGVGNRTGTDRNGWFTFPWSGHARQAGFSYRGAVDGQGTTTSYLWEFNTENQAIPFTQMFVRPRLTTVPLASIPDRGLAAQKVRAMLDDRAVEIAGGVSGVLKVGDSEPQLDTPVLAITTLGDRVYVGGKFSDTRDTTSGALVRQSYLAAFDRRTGAWISTFRPELDGTVWDLAVANGRLIVAGQFTNVNATPNTSALAALDPVTGTVDPNWRASMGVSGTTARPLARALDVDGDWIYVGGNFTQIAGPSGTVPVGRLARVSVVNGNPDTRFRPNVGVVPYDVDAANGVVQVVGAFSGINGVLRTGVGTVRAADGTVVAGLAEPLWTTATLARRYQQSVLAVSGEVWQGGSEHNVHVYAANDYRLLQGYVTADQGGDTQAFARAGGAILQGSHANAWIYTDATAWPSLQNYSRADVYNWIGAFDVTTHAYDRAFVPSLRSAFSEGAWELHTDVDGCVWFGGDFLGGPFVNGQRQYLEGFSKFCQRDTVAPSVPPAVAAAAPGGVRLTWSPSADDRRGALGYEILRNDRVVSPLVYGTSYTDPGGSPSDRYFVRSVDVAGNRSATTSVLMAADNLKPTTPRDLVAKVLSDSSVDLTWTASTDNVAVVNYRVLRNGVEIALVPGTQTTVNLPDLGLGTHWLQVQAIDNVGNQSNMTASARVDLDGSDVTPPSVPRNLAVSADPSTVRVTASWDLSNDNVAVTAYTVYRNGAMVATINSPIATARLDLGYGDHRIQIAARDAAGNESAKTAAVLARLVPPDTNGPSVPVGLTAVFDPITRRTTVSWSASTDPSGIGGYSLLRDGMPFIAVTAGTTSTVIDLPTGTHAVQVSAQDTFGNRSAPSDSVLVEVPPPPVVDTTPPSTPRDPTAVVQPDGAIAVAWTASRDNIAVVRYSVTRNAVEVASVAGSTTNASLTGLGPGDHFIQVQAFDAAGNASFRTASVKVTIIPPPAPDTQNPTTPRDLVAVARADGSVNLTWTASKDNVGVSSYRITRNGSQVAVVAGTATTTTATIAGLGAGTHYLQVQAFDAAGNMSFKTPSAVVVI